MFLIGCSVLTAYPDHRDQKQRFENLNLASAPVDEEVSIHWNGNSIPFVEAETDRDLAFAIGVTHAHLRLGQMELLRHVSQGRLSEVAGPIGFVEKVDELLRVIDFRQAGENSLKKLSPVSKMWLSRFTKGVNWYIQNQLQEPPVEFELLGKEPTPYTQAEILTLGKLIGADLTWTIYLKFLKLKEETGWEDLLKESTRNLDSAEATANTEADLQRVIQLLESLSKSGSNSLVVSGKRTKTGSAMIASDPHVGIFLPNFWLLMGIKSDTTHAIGYMIPGVPFIGVGRNEQIAWGGTNMRGISSHLYRIPKKRLKDLKTQSELIKRRWWPDTTVDLRISEFGPIFNDNAYFDQKKQKDKMALYWVGRRGSDELNTFIQVQKSSNWQEFRKSFDTYEISAMNILYADRKGNIGMVPAYGQPVLKDSSKTLDLYKEVNNPVIKVLKPTEQSNPYNPKEGFIASANNKPFSHTAIPYSYMFSSNDRVSRMKTLMEGLETVTLDQLKSLQNDVYNKRSHRFAKTLTGTQVSDLDPGSQIHFANLKSWDGRYGSTSKGAATQEVVKFYAWEDYIQQVDLPKHKKEYRKGSGDKLAFLEPWVSGLAAMDREKYLKSWLKRSKPHLKQAPTWGDLHRQPQQSPFGMIPVIGSRFALDDYPANGGDNTLNKSGRKFSPDPESVTYGASARHISDLSDVDENYFVMHGGNDGWLMNDQLADQVKLWRKGKYIKLPLSMDKVKQVFNAHTSVLQPQK
ncbi:MAG: penicillin acylase family protein [Pseudomonadota bacterium]